MTDFSDDGNERRNGRRYALTLPLQFENDTGTTCNVSSAGVSFTTMRPPRAGEHLRCALRLGDGTAMHFEAVVVRVEQRPEAATVAARFEVLSGFESLKDVH